MSPPDSPPPHASDPNRNSAAPPPAQANAPAPSPSAAAKSGRRRRPWAWGLGAALACLGLVAAAPWIKRSLTTVSTDDAYVNGHVTFVAPRVEGQVISVLVDDNNRVHKGDLLVRLDPEPFDVRVRIAEAGVTAAQADVAAALAQARGLTAQARSLRFSLERAMEDTDNQVALLRARVAELASRRATFDNAKLDYERIQQLFKNNAAAQREIDDYKDAFLVAQSQVEEALQGVYQIRVGLGLPPRPAEGDDLAQAPADLNQTASAVRQAQASLIQAAVQLGIVETFSKPPRQMLADFYKRDPEGNIDRIFAELIKNAPAVKQAQARLAEAQRLLDQARLDRRYCDVTAEIDGVVTRRNVNPGNHVAVGENLMAVRSLTEVWVDANFKETQLAGLRIGQAVDIDADMYGRSRHFRGRISGFTMGTGSTLALLPPQNATGNFVKVVQRLPVRIDLTDYDPEKTPLFIGLSVTPYVLVNEPPTGPDAGKQLQPYLPTTAAPQETGAPETRP